MTLPTPALGPRLEALRLGLAGRIIEPGDAEYDAARRVAGAFDLRPAAIVRVASDEDVRRVVAMARETGTELAVRSGGHSSAGHGTTDGGIVLDLRDMTKLDVDPSGMTAWAETGLTAGAVTKALGERGLVIGFGDTATVGIGGITVGGGVGYLARKHGLTIDSVLAADVVTAGGELLRTDASNHPDLFWAIRGGGGNFGVVTRFQFRLHELPSIVGGTLIVPATAETIERFMALADAAPDELSAIVNVMSCPPLPFVDASWHGTVVIYALLCFAGDAEAGEAAIAPFRELARIGGLDTPIADQVRPMSYSGLYPPDDESGESEESGEHPIFVGLNLLLDRVDRTTAGTIVSRLEASDATMRVVQLRAFGGAMARVPVDATAFAHRKSRFMAHVAAMADGEADRGRRQAWVDELAGAIRQSDLGAYANFVGDEGEERIHAIYPGATWTRLAEIKRRYDPENLFRRNQNIPPA